MSKRSTLLASLFAMFAAIALVAPSARAASLDSRMYGMWVLDVPHSTFGGPYPAPKSGLVNWTEQGLVFAITLGDGSLYADATVTVGGCILVGVPASYGCEIRIASPTHVHLTVRDGQHVERDADIELIDDNTERTVHRVTPADGAPYTETTLWTRVR